MVHKVICIAPVNIAVIKYWGKKDEELILPINDSLSCTLSTEVMCAKTTINAAPEYTENKFMLNGKSQTFDNKRLLNCITEIKNRADPSLPYLDWKLEIVSENNFPTAAGLASSAAGYACLTFALAALYNVKDELSRIARMGSGSACRSIYGGWVKWQAGTSPDGSDSLAIPLAPSKYWPEMRVLILVANDQTKRFSSTNAMRLSVETSDLIKYRAEHIVPKRIKDISKAILDKDFHTFAEITMKDSNQFHAICMDTYRPCVYLNQISHCIIDLVHCYNDYKGKNKVAYTFDAGPNACIYLLESEVTEFANLVERIFPKNPTIKPTEYYKGLDLNINSDMLPTELVGLPMPVNKDALKYLIHTKVGEGPQLLFQSIE